MSELDGNKTQTMESLLAELNEAKAILETAMEEERKASRRITDARNVYNGISKRIDAALAKLKNDSPSGTDWSIKIKGVAS